jgi:hypothetical protein
MHFRHFFLVLTSDFLSGTDEGRKKMRKNRSKSLKTASKSPKKSCPGLTLEPISPGKKILKKRGPGRPPKTPLNITKIREACRKLRGLHLKKRVIGACLIARELNAPIRSVTRLLATKKKISNRIRKRKPRKHLSTIEIIASTPGLNDADGRLQRSRNMFGY